MYTSSAHGFASSLLLALALSASALTFSTAALGANAPRPLSAEDEAVRQRVVHSLQQAPYFYDGHVTVSMEKGAVVLRGLVFSDWDLRDAVRIATRAADGKRVIDDLSIVQGGRR
jgi:osmotically-inducible protein OsmY